MEFFKEDVEVGYFDTPQEMVNKVRYYLENRAEAARLRRNAREAAWKHSYHERVEQILALLNTL
jgi:spore maturation protein CgeB